MRAERKRISFIGIGSATAAPLLYSYVRQHPVTYVPDGESHFFSSTEVFKKGVDWYESLFGPHTPGLVYGELAGGYMQNAQAASLIARTYPSAKLIAVVENPLVSVRVAYVEARHDNKITAKTSLAQFLKQNPDVLLNAKYGRQLTHYFSYYAPTDLMVVTAGDVREDPLGVLKAMYEHIGVDPTFVPVSLRYLVPEEFDEKKKPGPIKRNYRKLKKWVSDKYSNLMNFINPPEVPVETASQVARKLPLSPELEAYLKAYYAQDVAVLSRLMHRSLTAQWGFDTESDK